MWEHFKFEAKEDEKCHHCAYASVIVCERDLRTGGSILALNIGFNEEQWVRNFVVYNNMLCQRLSTFLSYDDTTFRRVIRPFADARGFLSSLNRGDVA